RRGHSPRRAYVVARSHLRNLGLGADCHAKVARLSVSAFQEGTTEGAGAVRAWAGSTLTRQAPRPKQSRWRRKLLAQFRQSNVALPVRRGGRSSTWEIDVLSLLQALPQSLLFGRGLGDRQAGARRHAPLIRRSAWQAPPVEFAP